MKNRHEFDYFSVQKLHVEAFIVMLRKENQSEMVLFQLLSQTLEKKIFTLDQSGSVLETHMLNPLSCASQVTG